MKILIDTREQKPFDMTTASFEGVEFEIVQQKLDCGDYSVEGLKEIIAIERKASTGELYQNLAKVKMRERFHRELVLLNEVKHSYIICEFPETAMFAFPKGSGIPKSKMKYLKMTSGYLRKLIHEIEDLYDTEIIYCEDRTEAERVTFNLLSEAWEKYGNISS